MTEPDDPDPIPPVHPVPPVDVPPAVVVPVVDPPAPPVEPPAPPVDEPSPGDPKPDRPPATDWREPPWFPPRDKDRRERKANLAMIVIGLLILAVGVYYFLDQTLGVTMPRIQWGSLWPVLLIVLGGVVLLRSVERR